MNKLSISAEGLFLPLKTSFKQASSVRNVGESIWVRAIKNQYTGLGEGCPRSYVTQEEVVSGLEWLVPLLPQIAQECTSLESLRDWVAQQKDAIDQHPAAWCAVELALLDLFAREQEQSVEELLGIHQTKPDYSYTAVLGDGGKEQFKGLLQRYLMAGFRDFKVKVNGDQEMDLWKLKMIEAQCLAAGLTDYRVRLDANNYWSGAQKAAIAYLKDLNQYFFGLEEPVEPRHPQALSEISEALQKSIILDESLLRLADLKAYDQLGGVFIANIKVSRVGGILRSLELIAALRQRKWPIIIGAHVGETSVLTRAGMLAASAAGDLLLAQEGGYGTILLERDQVRPVLQFGQRGILKFSASTSLGWGMSEE